MPVMILAGCDEVPVHGPVVVFAEGEAVGRMVVAGCGEWDEVGGVDEGDVVAGGEADAQAAGGALVIVDIEDETPERGGAAVFGGLVCDAEVRLTIDDFRLLIFDFGKMREIAGDERLAHELAVRGNGGEVLEAIGEAGEDLADIGDADLPVDRGFTIGFDGLPESIACQMAEGEIRVVLVVVFADEEEARREAVADFLAPWDALGNGLAFVDEIEGGEQQQGFVRFLVG